MGLYAQGPHNWHGHFNLSATIRGHRGSYGLSVFFALGTFRRPFHNGKNRDICRQKLIFRVSTINRIGGLGIFRLGGKTARSGG